MDTVAVLIKAGFIVYSPICHWRPIALTHDFPHQYSFWQRMDRAFIKNASGVIVLMLDGWRESIGVKDEIKLAKELRLPIMYIEVGEKFE